MCARSSMDRASDSGSECWGFESLRAYHVVADCVSFATTFFFQANVIARSLRRSSSPTATRCAGLAVGVPPCGRLFSYQTLHLFYQYMAKRKDFRSEVLFWGFRGPLARSTLRYFNTRGRQSRPCAIPGRRLGIYAPPGARPRRAVVWYFGSQSQSCKYRC